MATFKACIKTQRNDGLFAVFIRITHNRAARYINTGKTIDKSKVRKGEIKDITLLSYCSNLIKQYSERLNAVDITNWTANDIVAYLQNIDEDISFSKYARKYVRDMAVNRGMERNSKNYKWAYQSLEKFAGTDDIMFSRLTTKFIQDWIKTLESTSRAKEMYPICIRMIYNAGLEEYNDYDRNIIRIKLQPFRKIEIPKADVPEKRALSIDVLRAFFNGKNPETKLKASLPELSKDIAEMVFCLAGMNTADIFELRKNNLKEGMLCYQRQKTKKFRRDGAYLEIKIPERIIPLFNKYMDDEDSEYLLNFNKRYQDSNCFNINVNHGLKAYCEYNKLPKMCIYNFRHSWATIAQNYCGASIEEVGFALNHSSAHKITEGYIQKDYSPITRLNTKVLDCIFSPSTTLMKL
jgi:integrase